MTAKLCLLAVSVALCLVSCGPTKTFEGKRIVVIGVDGMDPGFIERHWNSLHNLRRLATTGSFQRLGTTMPPQSPVAWSTFITGTQPAQHGVFDFVHRNPTTLAPFSSIAEIQPATRTLSLGPFTFPLSTPEIRTVRRGKAFWQDLSDNGVPVTVVRMPANFPPAECEGRTLSGMGVPDLQGTFGTFTYYTTDPQEIAREVPGGRIVTLQLKHHAATLSIEGPANPLRKDKRTATVPMRVFVDPDAHAARFDVGGTAFVLNEREWSEWIPVTFPLLGPAYSARGMFRVYAKTLGDDLGLYVSPVNLDPTRPELPISTPSGYSRELADAAGLYYTQGIAEDTAALRQGVFSMDEYLSQSALVAREHLSLLREAVRTFRRGLLFFHFFGVDQNSHVLWGKHDPLLLQTYRVIDRELGWILETMPDATLIVMSDHGFTSFERSVHLNAWLRDEGFLSVADSETGGDTAEAIDWKKTQAYSMGLNGLYLNLSGREQSGIVAESDADSLTARLTDRLLAFRDADGRPVVDRVQRIHQPRHSTGPDLLIGYHPRFRSSWQTALGALASEAIEDNVDAWIGDHCVEARHVPGVLLSNRVLDAGHPRLEDVTVTILHELGTRPPPEMTGRRIHIRP